MQNYDMNGASRASFESCGALQQNDCEERITRRALCRQGKRLLALALALGMVLPLFSGCAVVTSGTAYCRRFLNLIASREFTQAYEMLSPSLQREDAATPTPAVTQAPTPGPEPEEETAEDAAEEDAEAPSEEDEQGGAPETAEGADEENEQGGAAVNTAAPEDGEEMESAEETAEAEPTPTPAQPATPTPTLVPISMIPTGEDPTKGNPPPIEPAVSYKKKKNNVGYVEEEEATPSPTPAPTPTPVTDPNLPTPTPTPDAEGNPYVDKRIGPKEFVDKYTNIFEELQLQSMEYAVTAEEEGDAVSSLTFTLIYHTGHEEDTHKGSLKASTDKVTYIDLVYEEMEIVAERRNNRWYIQWSPTLIFPMMDWGDSVRVGTLQSKRGEILCDGVAFAQNVNVYTVFAVPSSIEAAAEDEEYFLYGSREEFARVVANIPELELTEEDVLASLDKARNDFASLTTFFPDEVSDTLRTTLSGIRGLGLDTANYGTTRNYPYGSSLAHIVGYSAIITKKEQIYYETIGDTRYNGDSWVGKYGLELQYEDQLTGTNGSFTYIQDVTGASNGVLYRTEAIDGMDLHLTVIPELQWRLDQVIENVVYDSDIHGAVIVMNPRTGAIQAITSFPGFDLNYVARGMPEEEWQAYLAQTDSTGTQLMRLYNRATQGLYPPGSTFKLMTAACLLENGYMTIDSTFPTYEMGNIKVDEWIPSEALIKQYNDTRRLTDPTWVDETWEKVSNNRPIRRTESTARSSGKSYTMTMRNSLITSDNLFFAYAALLMGWDVLYNFLDKVGWREAIEFELQEQVSVPQIYSEMVYLNEDGTENIDYENRRRNLVLDENGKASPQRKQTAYDLAVTGYGQGQLLVSPLQMACFLSAFANDGDIMVPYVVDSIWHASGTEYTRVSKTEPRVWKHAFQKSTVDTVNFALQRVCRRGESNPSYIPTGTAYTLTESFLVRGSYFKLGYVMAGKTGTAEIGNDKTEELAWFICWRDTYTDGTPIPDEEARLVCVMLELDLVNQKIPDGTEISQMKFDIARAMLKDDPLNSEMTLNYE